MNACILFNSIELNFSEGTEGIKQVHQKSVMFVTIDIS